MSRTSNNLGRGLSDLIGEVSQVRAVPSRAAPAAAPTPAPAPSSRPSAAPPRRDSSRRALYGLAAALALSLIACAVLAWRVAHPAPVEPVVIRVPVAAPAPVAPPAPAPTLPPRDTRLDWTRSLAIPGVQVDVTEARARLVFDQPVFQTRDQLRPGAAAVLAQVAAAFQPHAGECRLVVAGHTDDDPPRAGGPYRDNIALGYLRALAAADALRSAGVAPVALRATSAGAQGAPYPNTDAAGKQRNRTVTLLIERN